MDEQIGAAGIVFLSAALVVLLAEKIRRSKKKKISRRFWVHPYLATRAQKGRYAKDVSLIIFRACSIKQIFIAPQIFIRSLMIYEPGIHISPQIFIWIARPSTICSAKYKLEWNQKG